MSVISKYSNSYGRKKYFTCIHIFVYRLAYTFHETIRKKTEVALSIVYTDFLRYKTMN